ncbi:MAG: tetratricopeptide repeat protein [Polyangia bacterium]
MPNNAPQAPSHGTTSARYVVLHHFTIEGGEYAYEAVERPSLLRVSPSTLVVNAPVQYAVEGQKLYLIEDDKEEHVLDIVRTVQKEKAGSPSAPTTPIAPANQSAAPPSRIEDRLMEPDFGYQKFRTGVPSWQAAKEVNDAMAALRTAHPDLDQMTGFMRVAMESVRPNWAQGIGVDEYLESLYAISKYAGFAVTGREILTQRERADTRAKGAQAESPNSPPNAELTGTYSGVVQNLTIGQSADFTISVSESKGGAIQGCMAVKLPLAGSGYLRGTVRGSQFSFVVVGDLMEIRAEGQRDANSLSGTYLVPSPSSGPPQSGTFVLHKTSPEGPGSGFNILNCPSDAAFMREAAEQGNVSAQLDLGVLYLQGHGVAQDYLQAFYWVKLAAAGGVKDAKQEDVAALLESIATHLTPAALSQVQEQVRARLAAHPTKGK